MLSSCICRWGTAAPLSESSEIQSSPPRLPAEERRELIKRRLRRRCCACSVAAQAGAESAVGLAPDVLEYTLGGARVQLDVSGGDKWQVCVLTPRGSGLQESVHSTPAPRSSLVELKEMDEGL